jgi:superfamily II DNA helicase RecQ
MRALDALRVYLNDPGADWRSESQRDAVITALKLEQDIVAILPTGGGKTMISVIPSLVEKDAITLVVLPLVALMLDYQRKLAEKNVPHEIFLGSESQRLKGDTNLILVSADVARSPHWESSIAQLNLRTPVVRLVFDESHLPLTAQDFRQSLQNLAELRIFPFQLVLLSGTVALTSETTMIHEFGLHNVAIFRTKTNRPELKFDWREFEIESHLPEVVARTLKEHGSQDPEARTLIFVGTIAQGTAISVHLKCDFYHGREWLTKDEKLRIYNSWINGEKKVLVCTYSHVRLVIHAGSPREMIGFIQEVSRAGRDTRPATCILHPTVMKEPHLVPRDGDHGGKHAMYNALNRDTDCIRFLLTSAVDEVGTRCDDNPFNQKCSRCANRYVVISSLCFTLFFDDTVQ